MFWTIKGVMGQTIIVSQHSTYNNSRISSEVNWFFFFSLRTFSWPWPRIKLWWSADTVLTDSTMKLCFEFRTLGRCSQFSILFSAPCAWEDIHCSFLVERNCWLSFQKYFGSFYPVTPSLSLHNSLPQTHTSYFVFLPFLPYQHNGNLNSRM